MCSSFNDCEYSLKAFDNFKTQSLIGTTLFLKAVLLLIKAYLCLDPKNSKSGINPEDLQDLDYETYEKAMPDGSTITMYKCSYFGCTKEFNRVWGILDHGRTHKGIKPYC